MTERTGKLRVSLDAMGGDFAPEETIKGAVMAAREHSEKVEILVVGPPSVIERELAKHDLEGLALRIVSAQHTISDGGHAAISMRRIPQSSVAVASQLVRDGEADAVVGVGHTGACLVAAQWYLGLMPGFERAAAGINLSVAPQTFVIDLGPNPDAKPRQLLQFAVLGSVYARLMMGIPNPTVATLSNGSEEGKGTKQVREAYELLKRSQLNFIGNVEGLDVPAGKANVVVCDGFVGNVMIKFMEGLSAVLLRKLDHMVGGVAVDGLKQFRAELAAMTDVSVSSDNLAFLGVNGIFVPGHGRAKAPAIKRAVELAMRAIECNFIAKMRVELEGAGDLLAVADRIDA